MTRSEYLRSQLYCSLLSDSINEATGGVASYPDCALADRVPEASADDSDALLAAENAAREVGK